ncbi:hypothetical protein Ddye_006605 [Dipteronia dyeriana]|uniref:CSC1-like protein RXW8 n=1 Tax=Dipteronia dyeriana TaxID=168575 RepID=A0AAE0CQU8_9ROSI|nr:hypothetical protein Ddye_006605 [Dipteronia dyeriana]
MDVAALLTSAGINIAITVVLLSLYSILRKQPSNLNVYFTRRLASRRTKRKGSSCFERFVPSPSWILKAWETTEDEILALAGMDAVVFLKIIVFSIRIFCIASVVCLFLLLPVNYFGKEMIHKQIPSESLDVFSIANVREGSAWLWSHCFALYIISCAACALLYFEYKSITKMRLEHITGSLRSPDYFTVLVRAIPLASEESYSDSVGKYFMNYYASSYLAHQMVYRSGTVQKLMSDAEKMYNVLKNVTAEHPKLISCRLCCGAPNSFKMLSEEADSVKGNTRYGDLDRDTREKESAAAFVFFKTRYAAIVAAEVLQSANPMLWVTDLAPEPHDVLWSNLWIPYRQLWIRKITILVGSIAFMFVFLAPVTLVQGLTHLDQLSHAFPFLRGILKQNFINQLLTGYLPSVVLMLFLYTVPPTMMLFSKVEGPISRSGRKKSACIKVLYFTIWNVFFVNVLSGSIIGQLSVFTVRQIPRKLAEAVPLQAGFFMTYVLTSGWASLSCEIVQPVALIWNFMKKFIIRMKEDTSGCTLSFPYHTEVPKLLLFGLIGFICSILAPLILPLLLIYFVLGYLVYRNQIINVYITKYESGGRMWPIVHNTTIFSVVMMQIIALGVFGLKRSPIASGFTIPLLIGTLLFNEYCRQRFSPAFQKVATEIVVDMDREDERNGTMEEIYQELMSAYCQLKLTKLTSKDSNKSTDVSHHEGRDCIRDPEALKQVWIEKDPSGESN